jgi:hypothetical protein
MEILKWIQDDFASHLLILSCLKAQVTLRLTFAPVLGNGLRAQVTLHFTLVPVLRMLCLIHFEVKRVGEISSASELR